MVPNNFPKIRITSSGDVDVVVNYFQSHPRQYDSTAESWMEDILRESGLTEYYQKEDEACRSDVYPNYQPLLYAGQTQKGQDYKVIPCVERLSHVNNDVTEYAFMFSLECRSGNILIVH